MPQTLITLTVPAVESRHEKRTQSVTRTGLYEDELVLTIELGGHEQAANILYKLVTDKRDELVEEFLEQEDPDALEKFSIRGDKAEVGHYSPDRETVYLAALRATNDSYADNVIDQLLRWIGGDGRFDDIKDGEFRCREIVNALAGDAPDGTDTINPDEQLANLPDDHPAYFN